MGIGVSFGVSIVCMEGCEAFEAVKQVGDDGGVCIFIDGDPGGGMRDEDHGQAVVEPGFLNGLLDLGGDVQKLTASVGAKGDGLHWLFAGLGGLHRWTLGLEGCREPW